MTSPSLGKRKQQTILNNSINLLEQITPTNVSLEGSIKHINSETITITVTADELHNIDLEPIEHRNVSIDLDPHEATIDFDTTIGTQDYHFTIGMNDMGTYTHALKFKRESGVKTGRGNEYVFENAHGTTVRLNPNDTVSHLQNRI